MYWRNKQVNRQIFTAGKHCNKKCNVTFACSRWNVSRTLKLVNQIAWNLSASFSSGSLQFLAVRNGHLSRSVQKHTEKDVQLSSPAPYWRGTTAWRNWANHSQEGGNSGEGSGLQEAAETQKEQNGSKATPKDTVCPFFSYDLFNFFFCVKVVHMSDICRYLYWFLFPEVWQFVAWIF